MPLPPPLTTWIALGYLEAPVQGTTKPLFYQCVSEIVSADTETFLVKSLSSYEPMAREIVGNRLAQLVGLRTPIPALIEMPEGLAERVNELRRDAGTFTNQRSGLAAGALQFSANNIMPLSGVASEMREDALKLFVYDMLAWHDDRTDRNPNCAVTADGLIVYDFERCFIEMEPDEEDESEPKLPPWDAASGKYASCHMFYTGLKGATEVAQMVDEVLGAMTDEGLAKCLEGLPQEWKPEGERIIRHIEAVKEHADDFVESISRSLRT